MERLRTIAALIDGLSERTGRALSWLMPAMVVVIAVEVAARYVFAAPTIWAYDSALMAYAWLGLVGGAFAMKRGAHIRVDLITAHLSPRGRAVLELVGAPFVAFFLVLVVWQVGMASLDALASGSRRPTEWAPPLILFLATAPLGGALLLLQLASQMIRAIEVLVTGKAAS
ncbi:MAG TPA: TRAP transporter small permease subunit [Rhizobiales bacterium]|nr:TRAP transporter small permease subunit [Hyphomicrobiales bacterium]